MQMEPGSPHSQPETTALSRVCVCVALVAHCAQDMVAQLHIEQLSCATCPPITTRTTLCEYYGYVGADCPLRRAVDLALAARQAAARSPSVVVALRDIEGEVRRFMRGQGAALADGSFVSLLRFLYGARRPGSGSPSGRVREMSRVPGFTPNA